MGAFSVPPPPVLECLLHMLIMVLIFIFIFATQWNTVSAVQQTDPDMYHGYTGAFASFFATGDPNALKLTGANDTGVPPLSSGKEFNMHAAGFAQLGLTQFKTRCDYWRSVAAKIPI